MRVLRRPDGEPDLRPGLRARRPELGNEDVRNALRATARDLLPLLEEADDTVRAAAHGALQQVTGLAHPADPAAWAAPTTRASSTGT